MKTCDVCKGDGLVGVGENPHLKEGPVSTCVPCSGTGKVADSLSAQVIDNDPEVLAFGEKICEVCGCKMAGPGVTPDMECAEIVNHPKKDEENLPE